MLTEIITVNNVLANLCHGECSKCPIIARMQARRRLRHWSIPLSITLCFTPTHTSIRCRLNSFTYCALCGIFSAPEFVMKCTEVMAVRQPDILEAPTGLSHYCTFGLEAASDAQNVRVDATRGKENDQQNLSKR